MTQDDLMVQKANEIKYRVTIPVRRFFPVIFLLVSGVVLSFVMFLMVYNWERTNQRTEFESWAIITAGEIAQTITSVIINT